MFISVIFSFARKDQHLRNSSRYRFLLHYLVKLGLEYTRQAALPCQVSLQIDIGSIGFPWLRWDKWCNGYEYTGKARPMEAISTPTNHRQNVSNQRSRNLGKSSRLKCRSMFRCCTDLSGTIWATNEICLFECNAILCGSGSRQEVLVKTYSSLNRSRTSKKKINKAQYNLT